MTTPKKTPVGILGATGTVGQRFIQLLEHHPWFHIAWLGASDRSVGKTYGEATHWQLDSPCPAHIAAMTVRECSPNDAAKPPQLLFSSMASDLAGDIERDFAQAGHFVVSNSSHYRMDEDVPLLVPEINPEHLALLAVQRKRRGWSGAIVTNPNCAAMVLVMPLAAWLPFGVEKVLANTLQAASGAGYPGVPSLDILGNVIPYIGGDEEGKFARETVKILGRVAHDPAGDAVIERLPAVVAANCHRVPVVDGHMVTANVTLGNDPGLDQLTRALVEFRGRPQERGLPSAPAQPIHPTAKIDRPQPRRDAHLDRGMGTMVGRLRVCPVMGIRFTALSHNVIRGAAGAAVLNAELIVSEGLL